MAGAFIARRAGAWVDRGYARAVTLGGAGLLAASWLPLWWGAQRLTVLVLGIVVLDLAVQALHITNLNLLYTLDAKARNRFNAGYMTAYFLGGAAGSLASAFTYQHWGWNGVVVLGVSLGLLIFLFAWRDRRHSTRYRATRLRAPHPQQQ